MKSAQRAASQFKWWVRMIMLLYGSAPSQRSSRGLAVGACAAPVISDPVRWESTDPLYSITTIHVPRTMQHMAMFIMIHANAEEG